MRAPATPAQAITGLALAPLLPLRLAGQLTSRGLEVARTAALTPLNEAFSVDRFPGEQYTEPVGDPGLFGPGSVTWRVHADPALLVGGISALMLQALHPLAMAGVAEHSDFRERPLGRLSRTGSFVTATTFAATPVAEEVIATVAAVHTRVVGTAPDGRPYAANDADLLRWVHVAEFSSFLRAHRRYHPDPVRGADLDRYFAEVATVAERLGATEVPHSKAEERAYLRSVRPELVADDQAHEALAFLGEPLSADPVSRAAGEVLVAAAYDLLPAWARDLYGTGNLPLPERTAVRSTTFALMAGIRAIGNEPPPLTQATARAQAA